MKLLLTKSTTIGASFAFLCSGALGYSQLHSQSQSRPNISPIAANVASLPLFQADSTTSSSVVPTMAECKMADAKMAKEREASRVVRQDTPKPQIRHRAAPVTSTTAWHQTAATSSSSVSPSTHDDLYWLSRVIEAEAGGENFQAKLAVGDVVENRTHSAEYPGTVFDVVFQRDSGVYEFTSVENGMIYNAPSASSIAAAKQVLDDHVNVVPSALVFYNRSQTPSTSWVLSRPVISVIGNLTFAK